MAQKTENSGWICLHRSILDWEHFSEPNVLAVFEVLLLTANTRKGWWKGLQCGRGETFVSIEAISGYTSLSKPTIIKALGKLVASGEIRRVKIHQKATKTIISNFAQYQDFGRARGKNNLPLTLPQTLPQTLPEQQYNNNNNIIGGNNIAHARTHEEIIQDLINSQSLVEQYCKNERITPDQFKRLAEAVGVEWSLTGEHYTTESDTKKRLLAHIRSKAQALNLNGKPLAERKAKFLDECKALVDKGCDRNKVAEFARYYTQLEQGGERMLFETYRGWNTETRFLLNQKNKF